MQGVKDVLAAELAKPEPDLAAVAAAGDKAQEQGSALRHQVRAAGSRSTRRSRRIRRPSSTASCSSTWRRWIRSTRRCWNGIRRAADPLQRKRRRHPRDPSPARADRKPMLRPGSHAGRFFASIRRVHAPARAAPRAREPSAHGGIGSRSSARSAAIRRAAATTGFDRSAMPAAQASARAFPRVARNDQCRVGATARRRSSATASIPRLAVGKSQVGDDQIGRDARTPSMRGVRVAPRGDARAPRREQCTHRGDHRGIVVDDGDAAAPERAAD